MSSIKRHLVLGSLIAGSLAISAVASADESAVATPVATPTPLAWYQKIQVGGYVDAYYQMNLNELSSNNNLLYRAFDAKANQFSYGGGQLTLKQGDSSTGTGYFVDLLMGGAMSNTYGNDSNNDSVSLAEAYVTQTFGNATFTLGKFATPIGYELTYLPSDANFSRSLLYQQEPTYQTGLELSYNLPESLTAALWVDNGATVGWPAANGTTNGLSTTSIDNANNNGKGYGVQLSYAGIKNLNLTGTWYLDDNVPVEVAGIGGLTASGSMLTRMDYTNAVATYTLNSSLNFAGEYLNEALVNGVSGAPNGALNYVQQQGYALYATWNTPIANLSLSPRFTQWFDPNLGNPALSTYLGTNPYQLDDYTLTLKYQMGPLAHMLEYEATASNNLQPVFASGKGGSKMITTQQSLTYAAVYSF